jgi:hypothetical protein
MARNKLLNDLLTTIHLYINKIDAFLEAQFLACNSKLITLLNKVRMEVTSGPVKSINPLIWWHVQII